MAEHISKELEKPEAKITTPPTKVVKVLESLSCSLNQVEWSARAQELAEALKAVEDAETRKKSVTKQASYEVTQAEARADKLTDVVASHTETREVTVEVRYDYENGKVIRIRTDTDEVISERDMIDDERQVSMVDADEFIESAHRGTEDETPKPIEGDGQPDPDDDDLEAIDDEVDEEPEESPQSGPEDGDSHDSREATEDTPAPTKKPTPAADLPDDDLEDEIVDDDFDDEDLE